MNTTSENAPQQKMKFWNSLRGRITGQILLVSLLPLIILSVIFLTTLSRAVDNAGETVNQIRDTMANKVIGVELQTLAEESITAIDTYMLERIHDIQDWASTPVIISALEDIAEEAEAINAKGLSANDIEELVGDEHELLPNSPAKIFLQSRLARNPAFKEVFFTDSHGYNVAVSNPTSDFVQSDEEWWQTARENGIFIGDVDFDNSAQIYAVDIALRIDHPQTGEVLGVMKASLDISTIQDQISEIADHTSGASAILFEENGYRIADSSSGHSAELIMTDAGNLLQLDYAPAKSAQSNRTGGYLLTQDSLEQAGETDEIGYAPSAGAEFYTEVPGFTGFNWYVLYSQPTSVAFQALDPIANLEAALENLLTSTTMAVLIVGTLAAIVSIVFAFFVAHSIAKPVQVVAQAATQLAQQDLPRLVQSIRAVAQGNLTATFRLQPELIEVRSRDEVGMMAQAFNSMYEALALVGDNFSKMQASLRSLIGQVQESAGQVASASQQLNSAADQVGMATQQVAATTQQVAAGSAIQSESVTEATSNVEQMARGAEGIARGAQEQAVGVQKTSDLIDEMNDIVIQVGTVADSVTGANSKVTQAARHGVTTVEQTSRGMVTIRTRTTDAVEKVKEMNARSKEIGRIVETIDEIADKTDMLALNAAVEAARAGEHGRGFAVVADQVRKLSEDSKKATGDVNELIERVQDTVNEAIAAMESTANEVDNGTQLAGDTAQSLQEIMQAAEEAATMAEQISQSVRQLKQKSEGVVGAVESVSIVVEENTASAEQMAANSQEVMEAMEGMAGIAEENSAAIEEVSASAEEMSAQVEEVVASAEELSALAEELRDATTRFRVDEDINDYDSPDRWSMAKPEAVNVPFDQELEPVSALADPTGNGAKPQQ